LTPHGRKYVKESGLLEAYAEQLRTHGRGIEEWATLGFPEPKPKKSRNPRTSNPSKAKRKSPDSRSILRRAMRGT
jgi:hypothetical protein